MKAQPRRFAAKSGRLLRSVKLWRTEPMGKELAMMTKTMGIAFSAVLLASAFALAASGAASAMTNKQCGEDWKAAKAAGTTSGMTYHDFEESHCKGAAAPAAAAAPAPAPAPAAAPAPAPAPAAAAPAPAKPEPMKPEPMKPAPKATAAATGAGQFAAEAEAKAHCPADTVVWVNTKSHKYHFSGHKSYGTTKQGAYMCEGDAKAAGDVAAKDEKEPK
jgi:hypothetical protein